MLLKISLVLAILVGLATLYFTGPVKAKIDDLTANVASAQAAQKTAEDAQRKATDEAKKTKATLEATTKELTATTNFLAGVSAQLNEQKKRADKASTELVNVTEERNRAQQELNVWTAIGIPVEKLRDMINSNRRLEAEHVALTTENKTLSRKTRELQAELDKYKLPDYEVPLPAGTHGKVVAVDPKYDFVVLDIGSNQGLIPDAKMLVNRDGKLIAKVKITRVEPNRAIANIIPEWKQDDVLEGDQVVY
jgi:cell shape-determining protein MreC